tara:strand:- start:602 stop:1135 length:534 start_codon:yes stop_codon:yes gene_type:complete
MFFNKKRRYKNKKTTNYRIPKINPSLIILTLILILFVGSFIFEINQSEKIRYKPNLEKLLKKNSYEKKTGHKISLEIQNGCGQDNIAFMYKNFLREEGFDVMDTKNAPSFDYELSQIISHTDNMEIANYLSKLMGINDSLIAIKNDDNLIIDLTLIIGEDFDKLNSYDNASLHYPIY